MHTDVYDEFLAKFVANMSALTVGDPMNDDTDVGPLATEQGREDVEAQVADAVEKGASVLCGGRRGDGAGWWYPPTVITGITPELPFGGVKNSGYGRELSAAGIREFRNLKRSGSAPATRRAPTQPPSSALPAAGPARSR